MSKDRNAMDRRTFLGSGILGGVMLSASILEGKEKNRNSVYEVESWLVAEGKEKEHDLAMRGWLSSTWSKGNRRQTHSPNLRQPHPRCRPEVAKSGATSACHDRRRSTLPAPLDTGLPLSRQATPTRAPATRAILASARWTPSRHKSRLDRCRGQQPAAAWP